MLVFILIVLLIAAAFGVLAAVIKIALAIVLSVLLVLAVLAAVGFYVIRSRLRRLAEELDRRFGYGEGRGGGAYPARGERRPSDGSDSGDEPPRLPPPS